VAIPPLGSGSFVYPANRRYLSGYNFGRYHPGLDFAGRLGEPIYASDAGTVIYAGYSLNAAGVPVGYGQYVVLDHGNGYQTLYAHASQLYVSCGQQVQKGAVIAAIGSVGRSTGPHLHYEIRNGGIALNPWSVLPGQ
jgi:murein DD-endopeptidase MepM/ murein hydrolase activator NlpD